MHFESNWLWNFFKIPFLWTQLFDAPHFVVYVKDFKCFRVHFEAECFKILSVRLGNQIKNSTIRIDALKHWPTSHEKEKNLIQTQFKNTRNKIQILHLEHLFKTHPNVNANSSNRCHNHQPFNFLVSKNRWRHYTKLVKEKIKCKCISRQFRVAIQNRNVLPRHWKELSQITLHLPSLFNSRRIIYVSFFAAIQTQINKYKGPNWVTSKTNGSVPSLRIPRPN